jgi:hypothetical protein
MLVDRVGKELIARHGKQRTYTQPQIQSAAQQVGYPIDVHCWAYCIFMDHGAFDEFHRSIGEACDYTSMKATMLDSLSGGGFQLPDLGLSWIEWPDIDLSLIFDWS